MLLITQNQAIALLEKYCSDLPEYHFLVKMLGVEEIIGADDSDIFKIHFQLAERALMIYSVPGASIRDLLFDKLP